jgi:NNP family nitrate/nitrite transporter-like MFS transporter
LALTALILKVASILAASYSIFASLFRALGGWLSDRYGARLIMLDIIVAAICTPILSRLLVHGIKGDITFSLAIGPVGFILLMSLLGLFMSFGKAAVYKHIPVYYPGNVGAVGGAVGMIGGLGGFLLPLTFGMLNDLTVSGAAVYVAVRLVMIALTWMHFPLSNGTPCHT